MIITPLEYFAIMAYILLITICKILWIYNSCKKNIIKGFLFYILASLISYIFYDKIYNIIIKYYYIIKL